MYYPLVAKLNLLAVETARAGITAKLREAVVANAVDALWVRVSGLDPQRSPPSNIPRYLTAMRSFHALGIPIVGDRSGTLGIAMLAFGALGGITSGITVGERYDPRSFFKKSKGKGFLPPPRVYFPEIGVFMSRQRAADFLRHTSVKNWFTCQQECCAGGAIDMLRDPRRHFIVTRAGEVQRLSKAPAEQRASSYMEAWLRPATDRATRAMKVDESLRRHRDRLDGWRSTFSAILEEDALKRPSRSASPLRPSAKKVSKLIPSVATEIASRPIQPMENR